MTSLYAYGGLVVVNFQSLRVIGIADLVFQADLIETLHSLEVQVHIVEKLTDIPRVLAEEGVKDIVLLPDKCKDTDAWVISGVLLQLKSRPTFLVYASEVNFASWSGVLDSGGADIITPPFTLDKVKTALQLAIATNPRSGIVENES